MFHPGTAVSSASRSSLRHSALVSALPLPVQAGPNHPFQLIFSLPVRGKPLVFTHELSEICEARNPVWVDLLPTRRLPPLAHEI